MSISSRLLLLPLLAAPLHGQGVRIVGAPGAGTFPDVQSAVDAAVDGDVLLIHDGHYPAFVIDDKSLTLATFAGTPSFEGTVTVRNLAGGREVLFIGLRFLGSSGQTALSLHRNGGHVTVRECLLLGGLGVPGHPIGGPGGAAMEIRSCARVTLVECSLQGGEGYSPIPAPPSSVGGNAGPGLVARDSLVVVQGGAVVAGRGGFAGASGGDGGDAVQVADSRVHAQHTILFGGRGGDGVDPVSSCGGDGGDGVLAGAGASVLLLDAPPMPGPGGISYSTPLCRGEGGSSTSGSGKVAARARLERALIGPQLTSDASTVALTITGSPGERVHIATALSSGLTLLPTGAWHLPLAALPGGSPVGVIPPSGSLALQLPVPDFAPSAAAWHLQALLVDGNGARHPSAPAQLAVLDRPSPPDCDANGVLDFLDVLEGTGVDCQRNFVLDVCDLAAGTTPDCNLNGVPDACDIEAGASEDLNGNGVPDECEPANVTWYVDAGAPAGGNGSAASPFQTIGAGVAVALPGDRVAVAAGLYSRPGDRDLTLAGRDIVVSGAGSASCIIDCQDASRAFSVIGGETSAARIEGFTIRNGNAAHGVFGGEHGGGILLSGTGLTLADCVIEDCRAPSSGGGLYAGGTASSIERCIVRRNRARTGAGIGVRYGFPRLVDCTVESNFALHRGGGIDIDGAQEAVVSHCRVLQNTSGFGGGGISVNGVVGGFPVIDHCLVAGNVAGVSGGGIGTVEAASLGSVSVALTSCTVVFNRAAVSSGGFDASFGTYGYLRNSVFWGNTAPTGAQLGVPSGTLDVAYCVVQGGQAEVHVPAGSTLAWGSGNVTGDPVFVDVDGTDNDPATFLDNDYRLGAGSPAVDAGDNARVARDRLDLDGDGDTFEPVPIDLRHGRRFADDPAVVDTGSGTPPLVDMGSFERVP